MTTPADRELAGNLTVRLEVGTRVATARVRADFGRPVQILVDDAPLLWRELSRRSQRDLVRRIRAMTPFEVRNTAGHRLMWSDRGSRLRWTSAGLLTLALGWQSLLRR